MAMLDTYDPLMELMLLVDSDVPPTNEVIYKLHEFADAVATGGPAVREKMLGLGAYSIITRAWALCCWSGVQDVPSPSPGASQCRDAVLLALYSLSAGFPDMIDGIGWQIISQAIDKTLPEETHILVLKLLRNIFIKSEENRENFTWSLGLVESLVSLISKDRPSSQFLREWCAAMKTLLLSDDVRVAYNRAPERKRAIGRTRILPVLAGHLHHQEYENDDGALNAIVILLGSMATNDDMCIHIESGNVLPGIHAIFKNHFQNKTLIRNAISLLRYLCVSDIVREKCSSFVLLKWVVELIYYYKKEADMVDVAMSCCAFMTLKSACQTGQFLSKNGLNLALQIINEFPGDVSILKGTCMTLRNVCENGGEDGREKVKEVGFPAVLRSLMETVPELKEFHIMPILKELGESEKPEEIPVEPQDFPQITLSEGTDEEEEEDVEG